jgi:uncharacterized protein (DUF1499 family)
MDLSKIGPLVALVSSIVALLLLCLAPLGWRVGWWPYRFALTWLMPASAIFAAIAVSVSLLALVLRWSELDLRALAMASVALLLGAALVYVPWQYNRIRVAVPAIDDITTDTDNPPAFSAVLPARAAEHAGGVDYWDPHVPQLQKTAYPDVVPLTAALPVAEAFAEALEVARSMPGWTVVASEPSAGRIEASQQSRWFRFTDDIVIRVAGDEIGSRIDMRSTSRQGRSDFGVNAARIRAYMGALHERIG